jgi:antitoxin HigA-1
MAMLAIHPGEHLHEELATLSMSAAAFARAIHVLVKRITQILKGERDISADTPMRLGHYFGTSAQFWMNLQSICGLKLAQDRNGRSIEALPTLKQKLAPEYKDSQGVRQTHHGRGLLCCVFAIDTIRFQQKRLSFRSALHVHQHLGLMAKGASQRL